MLITVVATLVALVVGIFLGKIIFKKNHQAIISKAEEEASRLIKEAEQKHDAIKKTKILEVKEKYLQLKTNFESDRAKKKEALKEEERTLREQKSALKKESLEHKKTKDQLSRQQEQVSKKLHSLEQQQQDLDIKKAEQISLLEKSAQLSAKEATERLVQQLRNEANIKASEYIRTVESEAKLTATKNAKKIVIETIQRTAAEHTIENCISVFHIESDDVKGKIIGREGRNIRSLEAATGVEFIVDDTPESIIISGFDPVRREIARLSLKNLVSDGRIHPARIEEVVAKMTKEIEHEIIEIGEKTVIDLGIHGFHPELIKMVGRMRFRSSYGQNLLQHSREVARMCGRMAAELGINVKHAKRAGLLHDIGKVAKEETELPHALYGMELAKKYHEHPDVCNAIGAHHDEIPMTCLLSPIVQACDAISGARPGARREVIESYIQRLKDLEQMALSFRGVLKCFAIQAGRELRVMVDADNINDKDASQLSFDISRKIETEMQYPGQIKVTVIREMRSVSFAK